MPIYILNRHVIAVAAVLRLTLAAAFLAIALPAADWPMQARDAHRSNTTPETPVFPLQPAWVYRSAQPPQPAWPEPEKLLNRMDFDYAFHPVTAGGLLCFGSSADDSVRALDTATGAKKWRFTAGGPVRFAPQIVGDRVYFSADDGFVYCVSAATGKLVWKFMAAPADERLLGNERMISRWPGRTGVLVLDGVVYTTAGMWSSEGVYVYALDAANGQVIWCNDTSGIVRHVRMLHTGSDFAMFGVCPQGALLATDNQLIVPAGKGLPATYNRHTGKLIYYDIPAPSNQAGGSWITIDGDHFHTTPYIASFRLGQGERRFIFSRRLNPAPPQKIPGTAFSAYTKSSAVIFGGKPYVRAAYGLILAGNVLIEGQENAVAALDAETQAELWRAPVDGQARGLAFAAGRLFVSTDRGSIHCFMPAAAAPATPTHHDPAARFKPVSLPTTGAIAETLKLLGEARIDRGWALVLGDRDGSWSMALTTATNLNVINALGNETEVTALREKLLESTRLYGRRIQVQTVAESAELPFADYFANTVIVAADNQQLNAPELYRVLRPCGGLLLLPGLNAERTARLLAATGALAGEADAGARKLVRGRLPGALDWDSGHTVDQRVKWPLRLLWFGGPGPALAMDRKQFTPIGPAANGRYFIFNETAVTAVDAYNGTILWSRNVPAYFSHLRLVDGLILAEDAKQLSGRDFGRGLNADADSVWLTLKGYFRGGAAGKACIRLDAVTGEQRAIYGLYTPPPQILLSEPQTWPLEIDADRAGSLTMAADNDGLRITLISTDPQPTEHDHWDLFFDFRHPEQRYGLLERGAFTVRITPADSETAAPAWAPAAGTEPPQLSVTGQRRGNVSTTVVHLPWSALAPLTGDPAPPPLTFDFAARLTAFDGGAKELAVRRALFCDAHVDALNNGWATIFLKKTDLYGSERIDPPAIFAGTLAELPKLPPLHWGNPNAAANLPAMKEERLHALTGEPGPKFYQEGGMCGRPSYSANIITSRSTALGIHDFADDSGVRTFDGIKPGCIATCTQALGLLISSEGRGGCECTTNFQTSLAMAPVNKRSNEDWALHFDLESDALIRHAAINFGAPGDRRADDGRLWLGFPRIDDGQGKPNPPPGYDFMGLTRKHLTGNLRVPLQVTIADAGDYRRVNADRTVITDTDQPWIYASQSNGLRKAVMKLDFVRPVIAAAMTKPPVLDGTLAVDEWPLQPQAELSEHKTRVFITHDTENLYVAARREPAIDTRGRPVPWRTDPLKGEAMAYNGMAFEVFLGDDDGSSVMHLAVDAGGARFDALTTGSEPDPKAKAWNGDWQHAAVADTNGFTVELAIPWQTIAGAGLDRNRLGINLLAYGPFRVGEGLRFLGTHGRNRCSRFAPLAMDRLPPAAAPRRFTVRLHFAELDPEVKPGDRVFTVSLQGRPVLAEFDIAAVAGSRHAVIREFSGIEANAEFVLELTPVGTGKHEPVLAGLEIQEEPPGN